MDDTLTICVFAAVIFAISVAAARIPFFIKKDVGQLHKLIAFSSGVMLGVLFLMLMPEAFERTADANYSYEIACYMILVGFLFIFIIDFAVKKHLKVTCSCKTCADEHTHDFTSISAFAGLSIHSFFDGLALAAAFLAGEEVGILVLIALCLHKAVVVFSLSSTMLMSKNKKKTWIYLLVFSVISPLAAIVSYLCLGSGNIDFAGPALCFSVGIFMFVAVCDMLPEAFHNREKDNTQMLMLVIGLIVVLLVSLLSSNLMGGLEI